jgi:UPF0755 protein
MLRKLVFSLICSAILVSLIITHLYFRPIDLDHEQVMTFSVSSGEPINSVAARLRAKGYIGWVNGFIWLARFDGSDRRLKAGRFVFRSHFTPKDILRSLTKSPPGTDLKLTFPEGLNKWQVADRLAIKGWNRRLVLNAIDTQFMEGKLFPDTYRLNPEMSERDVLKLMSKRFQEVWKPLVNAYPNHPKLTKTELLTLASMVEKETVFAAEAPTIARVFLNRLKRGMKLQSDPTYVYTAKRYGKKPTRADRLHRDNPYNTDAIPSLPPGPISNPGRNSIRAALNPDTSKQARSWLYFVAKRDGSGQHYFSRSYTEHKRAIKTFLKSKKAYKRTK